MNTRDAYKLFHQGTLVLSEIEGNGMRVDIPYCQGVSKDLKEKIRIIKKDLEKTKLIYVWRKTFGASFNIDSNSQLAVILFKKLGVNPVRFTQGGSPATDEPALKLASGGQPDLKKLLELRGYQKTRNTFLKSILRESVDGICRPFYNLHLARSFRSSGDHPNPQNFPIRDPEMGAIIRKCFIPRKGGRILEVDFSGIEVRISACYHKDPIMVKYITDKSTDMHRDMAMECYKLKQEQVTKMIRYCAKNMFVFPQFYGDYFVNCARSLWEAIDDLKLVTEDGISLKKHLRSEGLGSLDRFTEHIKKVEKDFWHKRFKVYTQWKEKHYNKYLRQGYFDTLTGFRCSGPLDKNAVLNYPIQGSAFHCLLWCLIQVSREIRKRKMKSLIIGQIHDSILFDVAEGELDTLMGICKEIMTDRLVKTWDWICVPIEVEMEASGVDESWYHKKKVG